MSGMRVIATGLCFPEGPVAMRDGSVVLVEIERQTISRILPDGSVQVIARTGGGPNGPATGRPGKHRPVERPFGPPPVRAITCTEPSGRIRLIVWRSISTNTTEP